MSREKNESIISLCVYTTPVAEDLVSALLESIFETSPSIWSDKETKESKVISSRDVVLFKPSKEFKNFINLKENG